MPQLATVVIDMLNPYDHEDGETLAKEAKDRIGPLVELIESTRDSEIDLIYVNDNYEDFTATSKDLGEAAMKGEHPELVEPILPPKGTLFVQKSRHSIFYNTALDHLLRINEVDTLVMAGQVTEQCVLYSALDAHVRGFDIRIPEDAVVPIIPDLGDAAIEMMKRNMSAEVMPAAEALG